VDFDYFSEEDISAINESRREIARGEGQELRIKEGFGQIARGEYITADDYMAKRGLKPVQTG